MSKHGAGATATTALVMALAVMSTPVFANETGLAGMHEWRKVGKRMCHAEHTHYGSSVGHRSKKEATAAAIKSWAGFTEFEYGSRWADFRKAWAKKISCNQGASGWSCDVEARACRG